MLIALLAITAADVWAAIVAHAPAAIAVVVAVLPSAITFLTKHPNSAPTNVLRALQYVMQALSFLKHADESGAFKLPLTWSNALRGAPQAVVVPISSSSGGAAVAIALVFLAGGARAQETEHVALSKPAIYTFHELGSGGYVWIGAELQEDSPSSGGAAAPASAPAPAPAPPPAPAAAAPVAADPSPTPSQFGGCTKSGKLCFAPEFAVTVAALNLSTKKVEAAFAPGGGYGFTVNPGAWSSFGAGAYFTLDPGANQASATILAKFINGYLRVGISKGVIGDTAWRVPFSFGVPVP